MKLNLVIISRAQNSKVRIINILRSALNLIGLSDYKLTSYKSAKEADDDMHKLNNSPFAEAKLVIIDLELCDEAKHLLATVKDERKLTTNQLTKLRESQQLDFDIRTLYSIRLAQCSRARNENCKIILLSPIENITLFNAIEKVVPIDWFAHREYLNDILLSQLLKILKVVD